MRRSSTEDSPRQPATALPSSSRGRAAGDLPGQSSAAAIGRKGKEKERRAVITLVYLVQMDYINTSHPNFVGGSKVIELAKHEALPSKASTSVSGHKDGVLVGSDTQLTAERSQKSRAIFPRDSTRGAPPEQPDMTTDFLHVCTQPPITLKPYQPEQDATEIAIVKLLIKSYYDIVRKNVEDVVPKAVMHFLVGLFIRLLCIVFLLSNGPFYLRDNLLNELMKETDEVLIRRKRIQETLEVLEQAHRTLEEFPLEAERIEKGYNLAEHATGLPKLHGLSNGDPCGIFTSSPNRYDPHQASHVGI
ncbi:hypothetical protein PR202_gb02343 [Eleusine coracana subsp. coracana]|uniref:GED domain-containing protein n=1 Tax=Eleusine coracana subsp. coracana TaxID=191504 RepID=A0AAV5DYR0_ELECO|nr:hypothetical protein PR202_gb02343 [Eleusine coracana subsp. coracana]